MKLPIWDEPTDATTPRGWYWPAGTTKRDVTRCAGYYLDYGPDHRRYDELQEAHQGTVICVVLHPVTGDFADSRYCENVEQAKTWVEAVAKEQGHTL